MYVILFVLLLRSFGLYKLSSIVVDFWLIMSHNTVVSLLGLSSLLYDIGNYFHADLPSVQYRDWETDRKSTRLNSSHSAKSRMPSSA